MSQTALGVHLRNLKETGILIVDTDSVKEVPSTNARVFKVDATGKAETEFKSRMYANMVMLGAIVKITKLVTGKAVEKAIQETFSGEAAEKNITAFKAGFDLIE
jgi:2-oxoglutarate ferredoxin oxidoreductase subunit gamma